MDEMNFEDKVKELVKEFGGSVDSPAMKLTMPAKQTCENNEQLKKSINGLQDTLDYLRVCIKYQLFDLEATRRENEYLKKLLEDRNG